MIKKIIIKILNFIRSILIIIKRHGSPPSDPFSHYNTFVTEQKRKSYETFKHYFLKSIFVDRKNYQKYIIERANENDPSNKKFYLEFGVFKGVSINFFSKYVNKIYGFDSFEGFGEVEEKYAHKFFQDSNFKWPYQKVVNRVNKLSKKLKLDAKIKKGFYKDTLDNPTNYGIEKASIIFLDSDLYTATLESLNFCTSLIQNGTIILIDEFFYFKGMKENTPYGAFIEWCKKNSFEFRVITHYGIGSAIVSISK